MSRPTTAAATLTPSASTSLRTSAPKSFVPSTVKGFLELTAAEAAPLPSDDSDAIDQDDESGCCKPPTVCGYGYVNPTLWINPTNPGADADCYAWSNDQAQLCYSCASCRAGLLGNLRSEWRKANIALIVAAVILIWVYLIACSAFKNAQTEDLFRRYKQAYV